MISILFVCAANTCRSPALEATLRYLARKEQCENRIYVDSCGTSWFHLGQSATPQMCAAAKKYGISIEHQAQIFQKEFFDQFDYIFAVTEDILNKIYYLSDKEEDRKKLALVSVYSIKYKNKEIPDPYYLTNNGFEEVMEIILDCCSGILDHIKEKL